MSIDTKDIVEAICSYRRRNNITSATALKVALIDMDGVLYDSMKYHTLAWQRMISELGIGCTRDEFYLYEGMTGAATINLIFEREYGRKADSEEIKRLYARKAEYFIEMGRKETMPGADKFLSVLMANGVERVLVTGSAQSSLLSRIDDDYPGAFNSDHRVTAHDVVHGKPDPEPYIKGLECVGVDARNAIVIENAPLGVRAGHRSGCFTIGITTGPIPVDELKREGADLVFESMTDFAASLPQIIELFNSVD